MRKNLGTSVGLMALSVICFGGLISRANAEEKLSFVQTSVSGVTISGYVHSEVDFNFQPAVVADSGSIALNPNSASPVLRGDINFISGVSFQGTLMDLNDSTSSHYIQVESSPVALSTPDVQVVPEPSAFALAVFAVGLIGTARFKRLAKARH